MHVEVAIQNKLRRTLRMARKNTIELLEKLGKKIKEAKELHEFEWDSLKLSCPHRKHDKILKEHGCQKINKDTTSAQRGKRRTYKEG